MQSNVVRLKPQRAPVADACRWHEAIESVAQSNLKILCAWWGL